MLTAVPRPFRAFTLVEILIVVVILGVLASIVVPQFASATGDAQSVGTYDQLQKIRKALAIYYVRSGNQYPNITAGSGPSAWGELMDPNNPYLREPPVNSWVGGPNASVVTIGNAPDSTYHQNYGWIWDPTTGTIWAAGFDANDQPLPRP
jgi:general secretion pathway protein G